MNYYSYSFWQAITTLFVSFIAACTPKANSDKENNITAEFSKIMPDSVEIIQIASGFQFTEGPVWSDDGYLLFSDIPQNTIYQFNEGTKEFQKPSGKSNGLAFDQEGRLLKCEHENRRLSRIELNGKVTVLADSFRGKRLNSPNDLTLSREGHIYFTDPPWGLPKNQNDPTKELTFNGVFRYTNGKLDLLIDSLQWPNGIALSPDEEFLYVGSYQNENPMWFKYKLGETGLIDSGEMFFDADDLGDNHPDGMTVDIEGNVYCTGPQGVIVLSSEGTFLGLIKPPELPANCAFGGADGKTFFMTARTSVYSVKLNYPGHDPFR